MCRRALRKQHATLCGDRGGEQHDRISRTNCKIAGKCPGERGCLAAGAGRAAWPRQADRTEMGERRDENFAGRFSGNFRRPACGGGTLLQMDPPPGALPQWAGRYQQIQPRQAPERPGALLWPAGIARGGRAGILHPVCGPRQRLLRDAPAADRQPADPAAGSSAHLRPDHRELLRGQGAWRPDRPEWAAAQHGHPAGLLPCQCRKCPERQQPLCH